MRHIFERLVRKFGFDAIAALVPEADARFMDNLKKRKTAAKKKKKTPIAKKSVIGC